MAAYKYPRFVEIIDELPKTTSGKIMRRLLKTAVANAAMNGGRGVGPAPARGELSRQARPEKSSVP